ncbi:MAG: hypothetical protein AAGF01_16450 [Cyanobacteria bacterium P01_G01_bin.38]
MLRLSKSQISILVLSGIVGSVALGMHFSKSPFYGLSAIAQEVNSSPSNAENFASLPPWFEAGSHPEDYAMGADQNVTYSGSASATLQAHPSATEGFGTLMQTFDASAYQGQRLRLSGYIKAEAVEDWAGLWMRVDSPSGQTLSFDNMQNRPIQGTTDWQSYDIVLDVPAESTKIAFGLLLAGQGQVWMDDLQFETVDAETPTTDIHLERSSDAQRLPESPSNLSFETL